MTNRAKQKDYQGVPPLPDKIPPPPPSLEELIAEQTAEIVALKTKTYHLFSELLVARERCDTMAEKLLAAATRATRKGSE